MTEEHPHNALHPQDAGQAAEDEARREDLTGEGALAGQSTGQSTGHPAVDEVLRSMDRLEDRPLEEHVAVFEEAHERLRRTLAGPDPATTEGPEGAPGQG